MPMELKTTFKCLFGIFPWQCGLGHKDHYEEKVKLGPIEFVQ